MATSNSPIVPKVLAGQKVRSGVILLLITLIAIALALYVRSLSKLPPLTLGELTAFEFDPYAVGLAVQELAVPIVLIYLFSATSLFRRIINNETIQGDRLKLFGALVLIQLVSAGYILGLSTLTNDQITFGFLMVIIGGLLGGWRIGLGLGFIAMLINGTVDLIYYPDSDFLNVYQVKGLAVFIDPVLGSVFGWYYLLNSSAFAAVWVGLAAGLMAPLWREHGLGPATALELGVGITVLGGYLVAASWDKPALLASFLLPSAGVSGLATVAITLIARNVQADMARRKAELAELARAQAELRALRAQINPHFLFNSINTIRYFVRTRPETARQLLLNLSEVFQQALRSGDFVSLRDEISYIEAYLALEHARLGERLQINWSIQVEDVLDSSVPTLILQPVVENAVLHGIAKKPEGGQIEITVGRAGSDLLLEVKDNGPGILPARLTEIFSADDSPSIGLPNIDSRLQALYGEDYRLAIESEVGQGTCVKIRIPGGGEERRRRRD